MTQPKIERTERTVLAVTKVTYESQSSRERPPSLGDWRTFIAACDGIPDEARVEWWRAGEGDMWKFSVEWEEPETS